MNTKQICNASEPCGKSVFANGLCHNHNMMLWEYGRTHKAPRPTIEERFWSFVDKTENEQGCWLWKGSLVHGYGHFTIGYKMIRAQRFAYELLVGPVPDGLILDHLCRVTNCIRPDHLEPVTNRENVRRGKCGILKTHCVRGHPLKGINLRLTIKDSNERRICKQCTKDRAKKHYWATRQKTLHG